jgi:hypothetical protein
MKISTSALSMIYKTGQSEFKPVENASAAAKAPGARRTAVGNKIPSKFAAVRRPTNTKEIPQAAKYSRNLLVPSTTICL